MSENNKRIAILAIHGMGTHLPLTGIQDAVKVIQRLPDYKVPDGKETEKQKKVEVSSCRKVLDGKDCTLSSAKVIRQTQNNELPSEVYVFEANYSSIPKGKAGLSDVIRFLFAAGWSSLGNNQRQRVLFGHSKDCEPRRFTHWVLLLFIFGLFAAILLNLTFVREVPLILGQLSSSPLTSGVDKYHLAIGLSFIIILVYAVVIAVYALLHRSLTKGTIRPNSNGIGTNLLYYLMILFPIALIASMFLGAFLASRLPVFSEEFQEGSRSFGWLIVAGRFVGIVPTGFIFAQILSARKKYFPIWFCFYLFGLAAVLGLKPDYLLLLTNQEMTNFDFLVLGAAFFGLSAFARSFLINYAGDVAAYVSGSKASKFAEVRSQVQSQVGLALDHLIEEKYEVIVLAHSLGSIVAYDVVNRSLLENDLRMHRIRAFITYGCPLDKIAYIFQTEEPYGDSVRNELIYSRQPLVQTKFRTQIPWWNVQAKHDIVGGGLIYYNQVPDPKTDYTSTFPDVMNVRDTTNTQPIASHSNYSDNDALSQTVEKALTWRPPSTVQS